MIIAFVNRLVTLVVPTVMHGAELIPEWEQLEAPAGAHGCYAVRFEVLAGDCIQHWRRATSIDLAAAGLIATPTLPDLELELHHLKLHS